jgi:hypothetical protein
MCFLFHCIAVGTLTGPAKKEKGAAVTHAHPPSGNWLKNGKSQMPHHYTQNARALR